MARIVDSLGAVYCSLTICRATRRDIVKILRLLKAHTERLFSLALSAILSTYFYFVRVSWPETKKTLRVALQYGKKYPTRARTHIYTELEVFSEI